MSDKEVMDNNKEEDGVLPLTTPPLRRSRARAMSPLRPNSRCFVSDWKEEMKAEQCTCRDIWNPEPDEDCPLSKRCSAFFHGRILRYPEEPPSRLSTTLSPTPRSPTPISSSTMEWYENQNTSPPDWSQLRKLWIMEEHLKTPTKSISSARSDTSVDSEHTSDFSEGMVDSDWSSECDVIMDEPIQGSQEQPMKKRAKVTIGGLTSDGSMDIVAKKLQFSTTSTDEPLDTETFCDCLMCTHYGFQLRRHSPTGSHSKFG